MAEQSLSAKLAEYEKLSGGAQDAPEAGAAHYLKRGALQGISALADVVPNLYNLGKAAIGYGPAPRVLSAITGKPKSTFMPEVGAANPIGNFLLENSSSPVGGGRMLSEPSIPSASIGGRYGAAALEGIGAGLAQGPMGLAKAAPTEMARNLLIQEARNAGIGASAGVGSQAGSDATGGSMLGTLAGGLIGGVVAPSSFLGRGGMTVGGYRAGKQTLEDIRAQATGKAEPAFSNYIDSTIKSHAAGAQDAAGNLTEGLRLREQIPGFNPSVAEMANAPGLLDMQKKFAIQNAKNMNSEVARGDANIKAVQDFYRSKVPAAESPSSVRSSVNQSIADYEKLVEDQARGVAGKLPVADQMAVGGKLTDLANAEKQAAKPAIDAAYQKAFDESGNSTVSAAPIVAKVEDILGEKLSQIKPENSPQTVSAIKRIFGSTAEELTGRSIPPDLMTPQQMGNAASLTHKDLHDIRVAINQDMASASRSSNPAAATRMYNLRQVMPEVDAAIAQLPGSDAYKAANAKYATEYAPRFKEGTPGQVFRDKSTGEQRILPDQFVSEFFKPDSSAGGTRAMQFNKLFGQNAEAKDAAKTGILDIYRQKVVNPTTGAIEPKLHEEFLRDYGRTLGSYKMAGVNALDDIKSIGAQATKVADELNGIRSLAKSMKFDTVDDLANNALQSPKTMGNTLMRLNADTRVTFKTLLLDKAFESGTASGMEKFLAENQKTLRMAVPQEQLTAMNDIAKALAMTERAPIRGNLAAGGADMLKNSTGVSTATVFSQIRAVTGGRSSVEWAAINLAMPALNKMTQTSFANVMEQALHSPQSAVMLRNYLMAETPAAANNWAAQFLNSTKTVGKSLWMAKGPVTKNFIGPQHYPENLGRSGAAIESQMNNQQSR